MDFRNSYFSVDEQLFDQQRRATTREYAMDDPRIVAFNDATLSFGACHQQLQQQQPPQLSYQQGNRRAYSVCTKPAFDEREQNGESSLTKSNLSDSPATTTSLETIASHSYVGTDESQRMCDQRPTAFVEAASRSTYQYYCNSNEKVGLQTLSGGGIPSLYGQQTDEPFGRKLHQPRQYQQQQQLLQDASVQSGGNGQFFFDTLAGTPSAISCPITSASVSADPVSSISAASIAADDALQSVLAGYLSSPMTVDGEQLVLTADDITSDLPPSYNRQRLSGTMTLLQQAMPLTQVSSAFGSRSADCYAPILPPLSNRHRQRLNHNSPPLNNQLQLARPLLFQTNCSGENSSYQSAEASVQIKREQRYDGDNEQDSADAACIGVSAASVGVDSAQPLTRHCVTTPSIRCRSTGSSTSFEHSSETEMVPGTNGKSATNSDDFMRRNRRREQNRRAARKCREKKKENVDSMKIAYDKTKAENERLRVEKNRLQLLVFRLQDLMRLHQSVCRLSQTDMHPTTMQSLSATSDEVVAGNAAAAADASDISSNFTSSVFQFDQLFDQL